MRDFSDAARRDRALLAAAVEAVRAAREIHRRDPGGPGSGSWTEKRRADFVTEVDREAEERILEILLGRFPDHVVLAEEAADDAASSGGEGGDRSLRTGAGSPAEADGGDRDGAGGDTPGSPIRWIVDPLDGTTNWLHGYPAYSASVAAVDDEGLRVGAIMNTATGELFEAIRGEGCRRDGEPARVSGVDEMRLALVGTGFPFKKAELLPGYLGSLDRVLRATSGVRRAGSAALDLCDVACGRLDVFWEYWLMPWDVAAGALMVREAGGVFRPLEVPGLDRGAPADPRTPELAPGGYLAGNSRLADDLEALVRNA